MKRLFYFMSFTCVASCSNKLLPGKYTYPNTGTITINKDYNYTFLKSGEALNMLSKGKALLKGKEVFFIPDSSYFFTIAVNNCYFDSALKGKKKIILDNTNDELSKFNFYFLDDNINQINIDDSYSAVYDEKQNSLNRLVLYAKIKDSVIYWPKPYHSSLYSNCIIFEDVNTNDPNNKPGMC